MRAIDADALQLAIVEEGQANKRKKYIIGDIWELTGAEIREVINSQPTIQPEPHWIPVTERLPNRDELVLVTYKTTSKIHLCKYLDDGSENSWWSYIDDCCAWNNVILAWMPLPEPYKGVTE